MSFIQREIERVTTKLQAGPLAAEEHSQLYAVQQALLWASEPGGFKSPFDMIVGTNIQSDSEGCPAGNGPTAS